MKKFLLSTVLSATVAIGASAQIGATAPDFTVTDLDGNTHNLYEILDAGKVVILDVSTTWCPPCWGFHQDHYLKSINDAYGPEGTDQVRVIFYEADETTTLDDLNGLTSSTQGNWNAPTAPDYAVINEAPITLPGAIYWPLGYPTVNVINPANKTIEADLFDTYIGSGTVEEKTELMNDLISEFFIGSASIGEETTLNGLSIFPNPANNTTTITFSSETADKATVSVLNMLGEVVSVNNKLVVTGQNNVDLDLNELRTGNYIVQIQLGNAVINSKLEVIK